MAKLASGSQNSREHEWSSLRNLEPLVKCLPNFAWMEIMETKPASNKGSSVKMIELIFVDSLEDVHFNVCREYARFIKHLGHGTDLSKDPIPDGSLEELSELSPTVYQVFAHHRVIPLPNLESYTVRTEAEFANLHRVVGPNTVKLEFASLSYAQAMEIPTFHKALRLKAPNTDFARVGYKSAMFDYQRLGGAVIPLPRTLRTLRLLDSRVPDEISASLAHFFGNMPDLKSLHLLSCEALGEDTFRSVLSSPTLQEFEIGLMKKEYLQFVPSHSPQRLCHLQVTVESLPDFTQLLHGIGRDGSSNLRSIKIECRELLKNLQPPLQKVKKFFSQLRSSCDSMDLAVVSMSFIIDNHQLDAASFFRNKQYAFTVDIINPLSTFKELREINIRYQLNSVHMLDYPFRLNKASEWSLVKG